MCGYIIFILLGCFIQGLGSTATATTYDCTFVLGDGDGGGELKVSETLTGQDCINYCLQRKRRTKDSPINGVTVLSTNSGGCYCEMRMTRVISSSQLYKTCFLIPRTIVCSSGVKTQSDQCCIFPFVYQGRQYDSCTTVDFNSYWCATTENYDKDKQRSTCIKEPEDVIIEALWPQGVYGILSHDKCPNGWYEFTHCMDTENNNNQDSVAGVKLALTEPSFKCDPSSVTLRYCFKGPGIKSRTGGFWTSTERSDVAYVIRNTNSDCSVFGADGGTVSIDNEDDRNQNRYGNNGLNFQKYTDYYPRNFDFGDNTILDFCKIGESKSGVAAHLIEVGEFNQTFGMFVYPGKKCPLLKSPYGLLVGTLQNMYFDDEDSNNNNAVSGGAPVVVERNSRWSICAYNPSQAILMDKDVCRERNICESEICYMVNGLPQCVCRAGFVRTNGICTPGIVFTIFCKVV